MRVCIGHNVFKPDICGSVDHAHDRAIGHISRCYVISIVTRVVPDFVDAAYVGDSGEDCACTSINHILVGRKCFAVVVSATYEEVVTRSLSKAGRHAIGHHETVDDYRAIGVSEPRIDFIDTSNVGNANGIFVCLEQVTSIGIPNHSAQSSRRYSASARAPWFGLIAKRSRCLIDERPVMARDRVSGTARPYSREAREP
jgi:hypothetical protein